MTDEDEYGMIGEKLKSIDDEISKAKIIRKKEYVKQVKAEKKSQKFHAIVSDKKYSENRSFAIKMIIYFSFLVVCIIGIIITDSIDKKNKQKEQSAKEADESRLNQTLTEIEEDLTDKRYEDALNKAKSIHSNYDEEKWYKKRRELIDSISYEKTKYESSIYIPTGTILQPPEEDNDLERENYNDVFMQFQNAGFKFICLQTTTDGWFNNVGDVVKITIDGVSDFKEEDTFSDGALVVIYYYVEY